MLSYKSLLDIPAGRVVRRAGSSSRKSGACRRASAGLAGASASSNSSGSAGSIVLPAPTTCSPTCFQIVPATSSLFSLRAVFRSDIWCSVYSSRYTRVASVRINRIRRYRATIEPDWGERRAISQLVRRGGRRAPREKHGNRAAHVSAGGENCSAAIRAARPTARRHAPPPSRTHLHLCCNFCRL